MIQNSVVSTFLVAFLVGWNPSPTSRQSQAPPASPSILEVTNTIHGVGHYVGVTLLIRVHEDGNAEWETNVDAVRRQAHTRRLSGTELNAIRERLDAIDQHSLSGELGPYATYVDTTADLRVHLLSGGETRDFVIKNPWPSGIKLGTEKVRPKSVEQLVCFVSELRARYAREEMLYGCEAAPKKR